MTNDHMTRNVFGGVAFILAGAIIAGVLSPYVPDSKEAIANVVLGNAFGVAAGVVVDTHVLRLSMRLGLSAETDPVKVERDLMAILPQDDWIDASHLLIWHGRRVCNARKPLCGGCTLRPMCPFPAAARRDGG